MDPRCAICDFFFANMAKVHFAYGLAFFLIGVVAALEATRDSELELVSALPYLAGFGLLHGFHEWLEMFETLAGPATSLAPRILRLVTLILSFVPLAEFGLRLGDLTGSRRWKVARCLLVGIFLGGTGIILFRWGDVGPHAWIPALDAWSRYSLAVPGSVLAAIGLYGYTSASRVGEARFSCDFQLVALALLLYGIPGQTLVDPSPLPPSTLINSETFMATLHLPIQLFRTVLAVLMLTFTTRGVRCFERERRRRLEKLSRDRLEAQRQLTEEMSQCRQLQRELLRRTVQAQEEERRYIARELHDETAQALTALSLGLGSAEEAVKTRPEDARRQLEQLRGLVDGMMRRLNRLTTRLRPTVLDDLGLIPALITYADHSARHLPFALDVEVTGERRRLPSEIETNLYRIAQESLTNVARHADADRAVVQLKLDRDEAILRVRDNGVGMSPERADKAATRGEGWGLAGIEERAALLEGDVQIHSEPGQGTEIEVRIPIPPATSAKGAPS